MHLALDAREDTGAKLMRRCSTYAAYAAPCELLCRERERASRPACNLRAPATASHIQRICCGCGRARCASVPAADPLRAPPHIRQCLALSAQRRCFVCQSSCRVPWSRQGCAASACSCSNQTQAPVRSMRSRDAHTAAAAAAVASHEASDTSNSYLQFGTACSNVVADRSHVSIQVLAALQVWLLCDTQGLQGSMKWRVLELPTHAVL